MNTNLASLAIAVILSLSATLPALAQYNGPIKLEIPFNFVVENERIPAGKYKIARPENGWLRIQSLDARIADTFLAIPMKREAEIKTTRFLFHHYGSEYFLSTIWIPGQETGWELLRGKVEKELAKNRTPMETATVTGH